MSAEDDRLFALLRDAVPPWEPQPFPNGERLAAETIYAAIEAVRANADYTLCVGSNRHVVSPSAYETGGWAVCANCFGAVYVPTPGES